MCLSDWELVRPCWEHMPQGCSENRAGLKLPTQSHGAGVGSHARTTLQHHHMPSAIYLGQFCPPAFGDARGLLDTY